MNRIRIFLGTDPYFDMVTVAYSKCDWLSRKCFVNS